MITFFGQPKFSPAALDATAVGYELLVREQVDGQWRLPEDLKALPPSKFEPLLRQALAALAALPQTITNVSFNLERIHFINPAFRKMIQAVQADTTVTLTVELTERYDANISNTDIVTAIRDFHAHDIDVCIDDIGSGNNLPGLVEALTPYVSTYKFGLQNLREYCAPADLCDRLQFWYSQAATHNKHFDVAGVESLAEAEYLSKLSNCHLIQGFYFGQPIPLDTTAL